MNSVFLWPRSSNTSSAPTQRKSNVSSSSSSTPSPRPRQLNSTPRQHNSKRERSERAARHGVSVCLLIQRNSSGSDSSLKCVHVRIAYTLTPFRIDPTFVPGVIFEILDRQALSLRSSSMLVD
jgi:hypothetical protein